MSEPAILAPAGLDERRAAESLLASATNIRRWLNGATMPTRRSAKDELAKLIAEARDLWSVL